MTIICGILILFLLAALGIEHAELRQYRREIQELSSQMEAALDGKRNMYFLCRTRHQELQRLISNCNRFQKGYFALHAAEERNTDYAAKVITNISHDLRTPLTVIYGYAQMLQGRIGTEKTRDIEQQTEKLVVKLTKYISLMDDFFLMAKIESADLPLETEKLDVNELCREVLLDHYDLLKTFQVELHLTEQPLYACLNHTASYRILKNLLDNSIRYSGEGAYLRVETRKDSDGLCVQITDHGRGMTAEELERLFLRGDIGQRSFHGSGLGLSIAEALARQMHGELTADSIPGQGSTFTWRIHMNQ